MSHPELLQSIIAGDRVAPDDCPVRDILDRIGDKWSLLVLHLLSDRTRRFTELKQHRGNQPTNAHRHAPRPRTRRAITRTIRPVIPPDVNYELTDLGHSLTETIHNLITWAETHRTTIDSARTSYDER